MSRNEVKLSDEELGRIEGLARAVDRPWRDADDWSHDHSVGCYIEDEEAEFVAALSPGVALALVSEVRRLRAALEAIRAKNALYECMYPEECNPSKGITCAVCYSEVHAQEALGERNE